MRTTGLAVEYPTNGGCIAGDDVERAGGHSSAVRQLGHCQCQQRGLLAGLTMMVQPAASAGATLRVIMAAGKVQGRDGRARATGSRVVTMRLWARRWNHSPYTRHAARRTIRSAGPRSDFTGLRRKGLPCSLVMMVQVVLVLRRAARCRGATHGHSSRRCAVSGLSNACCAAVMAC